MTCEVVKLVNGARAIVCGTRRRARCIKCKRPADLLCDWKVPSRRSGTCDAAICTDCTHSPAPDKDLCPDHARMWTSRAKGPAA